MGESLTEQCCVEVEGLWVVNFFPRRRRNDGRLKKQRKKALEDKANPHKLKRKLNDPRCGKCGEIGHTKRKCTEQPAAKGKKDMHNASTSGGVPSGSGVVEVENVNVQVEMNESIEATPEEMNISQESTSSQPSQYGLSNAQPSQMATFAEASFFQPMIIPPVRPPPVRPPPVRHLHTPITTHTMEVASSEITARFATYFQPRGSPPN
ncbi:hypothetical protein CRG98_005600 [Punica granatum]|uniref:CCHC-type domain-containing protein n=1 Tax=Punica granatum TaxID=22663 RepID=A0A2I0L068_PUNGR|nr:hypothetical protein CRG98_005600 [Punica granatum]